MLWDDPLSYIIYLTYFFPNLLSSSIFDIRPIDGATNFWGEEGDSKYVDYCVKSRCKMMRRIEPWSTRWEIRVLTSTQLSSDVKYEV